MSVNQKLYIDTDGDTLRVAIWAGGGVFVTTGSAGVLLDDPAQIRTLRKQLKRALKLMEARQQ